MAELPQKGGGEILCELFLCYPGWYVHKPDIQNKWDDNTHTQHTELNAVLLIGDRQMVAPVVQLVTSKPSKIGS